MGPDDHHARKLKRMRSLKGARFILDGRTGGGVDCRIVDLNSHGARIRFSAPVPVGERVELLIKPENKTVTGRGAWQKGLDAGIEFDEPLAWLERHDVMDGGRRP